MRKTAVIFAIFIITLGHTPSGHAGPPCRTKDTLPSDTSTVECVAPTPRPYFYHAVSAVNGPHESLEAAIADACSWVDVTNPKMCDCDGSVGAIKDEQFHWITSGGVNDAWELDVGNTWFDRILFGKDFDDDGNCSLDWASDSLASRIRGVTPQGPWFCPAGTTTDTVYLPAEGKSAFYCYYPRAQMCPLTDNPVSTLSGGKVHSETDFSSANPLMSLTRTYLSTGFGASEPTTSFENTSWRHSFDRSMRVDTFNGETQATLFRHNRLPIYFIETPTGWDGLASDDSKISLETLSNGYEVRYGANAVETYDLNGQFQEIKQGKNRVTLAYDIDERLQTVTDQQGRVLTFQYEQVDTRFRISQIDTPDGALNYGYAIPDYLETVTYPSGISKTYVYNDTTGTPTNKGGLLTGIVDELGNRYATYDYDSMGRVKSTEHAGGVNRHEYSYFSNMTRVIDALGAQMDFGYSSVNGIRQLTSNTQPCATCGAGDSQSLTYDGNGFKDLVTDFNNNLTDYDFDDRGLELQRVEAVGTPEQKTITTIWDTTFRQPLEITEPGKRTNFTYNTRGQVLTRTETDLANSNSRTSTFSYCEAADVANMAVTSCAYEGLLLSMDGPRTDVSDVTDYRYYIDQTASHHPGDLHTVTNALGHVTQYLAYDDAGRVLQLQDANGVLSTMTYHARGWLLSRSIDGATTTFEYDQAGQITRLTQANGAFTRFEYDAAQRMDAIEDNFGNRIEYTLDNAGNRTEDKTYGQGAVLKRELSRVYNQLSRLEQLIDSRGYATDYTYDANGNQETVADANSNSSSFQYDALERLTKTIDPLLGETDYAYDGRDNLVSVTDPRNLTTQYTYDGLDNLTQLQSPDTGTTTYGYDDAGNRTSMIDARGVSASYEYDVLGRLTKIDYVDDSRDIEFEYDNLRPLCLAGEQHATGRLTRIANAGGNVKMRFCYDARGNVTRVKERHNDSAPDFETLYEYDSGNVLTAMVYPSGKRVNYQLDTAGRVTSIDLDDGGTLQVLADQIGYEPFGPLRSWQLGNGLQITRMHDQDYRVTQLGDPALDGTYSYDPAGNITSINGMLFDGSYTYDALNRLQTADTTHDTSTFEPIFNQPPAVLAAILSMHNEANAVPSQPSVPWLVPTLTNVATDSFQYALERAEAAPGSVSQTESIGLIAISPGQGSVTDTLGATVTIDAQLSAAVLDGRDQGCDAVAFGSVFSSSPIVVAQQITRNEDDGGWLRQCSITANEIQLTIDEDRYLDTERSHAPEAASVVAFSQPFASTEVPMEAGEIALPSTIDNNSFHLVTFQQTYTTPPVVVALTSDEGGNPTALRIRNVTTTSFEIVQSEPSGDNGIHIAMTVHYWAVEPGTHELADGTRILATSSQTSAVQHGAGVSGTESWDSYSFGLFAVPDQTNINQTFSYDGVGNRLSLTEVIDGGAPAVTSYGYGTTSNQLTAVGGVTRQRDAVGNLLNDGTRQFSYDDRNRMVSATNGGSVTTYELNGRGERVKKTVDGVVTYFVYGQSGQLLGEYDGTGSAIKEYVYLNGVPVAVLEGADIYYIHTDHLATPRAVSDQTGQVIWRWHSDPFGTTAAEEDPDGDGTSYTLNLRFPGQYFDAESGLHYNYFRDHDAGVGRYVESDPIGLWGGLNTFSYVRNAPTRWTDPTGLAAWYCQRPLGDYSGENGSGPPIFNHQFICVTMRNGTIKCDSTNNPDNSNPWLPAPGVPSDPDKDNMDNSVCKEIDDDDKRCFEDCITRQWDKPRPNYTLVGPAGTNCQEYSRDIVRRCRTICKE